MNKKIPRAYLDIIDRFYARRDMRNKIRTELARRVLLMIYHFRPASIRIIFKEMHDWRLIKLSSSTEIEILWRPKPLE